MRPAYWMAWAREKQGMEEKGDTDPKRTEALFPEKSRSLADKTRRVHYRVLKITGLLIL